MRSGRASSRSQSASRAPSRASLRAVLSPMPRAAPITTPTRFSKLGPADWVPLRQTLARGVGCLICVSISLGVSLTALSKPGTLKSSSQRIRASTQKRLRRSSPAFTRPTTSCSQYPIQQPSSSSSLGARVLSAGSTQMTLSRPPFALTSSASRRRGSPISLVTAGSRPLCATSQPLRSLLAGPAIVAAARLLGGLKPCRRPRDRPQRA